MLERSRARIGAWIVAAALLGACATAPAAHAEDCNTNCHDQCRIKTDFPPIEFIEPTCHAKCEIAKHASCVTGIQVPNVPLTPLEQIKAGSIAVCESVFQGVTQTVIAQCSNWDGRLDDQNLVQQAMQDLVGAGVLAAAEFNDVQIRWCPFSGGAGITPDRNKVYLNTSKKNTTPLYRASLLAHEMVHVRQYRQQGTDQFKCNYSRNYLECAGCQDRRHPLEREAYDFEAFASSRLSAFYSSQHVVYTPTLPPPMPYAAPAQVCVVGWGPNDFCPMRVAVPQGSQCVCVTARGRFAGVAR